MLLLVALTACNISTVPRVNSAPTANDRTLDTPEDTPVAVTLTASDIDGDPLTFAIVDPPNSGALSGTTPDLTYTPNPDFTGTDTFTFTAADADTSSDEATVTIEVGATNDPPTINAPADQSVVRNTLTPNGVDVAFTVGDVDGDALTVTAASDDQLAVPDVDLDPICTSGSCTLAFTPNPDAASLVTITLTVDDGTVSTDGTLTVDIAGRRVTNTANGGAGSLRNVLNTSETGDVIGFAPNVFPSAGPGTTIALTGEHLTIAHDLTIEGPGRDAVSVDAQDLSRALTLEADVTAVVMDMSFQNGTGETCLAQGGNPTCGGGIFIAPGAHLTLVDSTVSDSSADVGGGIFNDGGGLILDRSSVQDNVATDGGGVYVRGGGVVDLLAGSDLSANIASLSGGGLFGELGGAVSLDGGTITHNSADSGGGIFSSGTLTLHGGTITTNIADNGGGIASSGGTSTIHGGLITENSASMDGGGIFTLGGTLTLNAGTITFNAAGGSGGGIYNLVGTLTVNGGTVSNNDPDDIFP
jgi:hypothetical protein